MEKLNEAIERHGLRLIQLATDFSNNKISENKLKESAYQISIILKETITDSEKRSV